MEGLSPHGKFRDDSRKELQGLLVLIVEDDYWVATDMCSALERRGASILGPSSNLLGARKLLEQTRPDCALIDINLNDIPAFGFLSHLEHKGIPIIVATGYNLEFLPEEMHHFAFLQKPVNLNSLVKLISSKAVSARSM